jgi:hypothetical protein
MRTESSWSLLMARRMWRGLIRRLPASEGFVRCLSRCACGVYRTQREERAGYVLLSSQADRREEMRSRVGCGLCDEGWWRNQWEGSVEMLSGLPLTLAALIPGNLHDLSDEVLERRSCGDHLDQSLISSHARSERDCASRQRG